MTMTVAKTSASFIRDLQFDDLSQKVRKTVQWALTDYVGVTIGGCNMPAAKILREIQVGSSGSASAKVFGTGIRLNECIGSSIVKWYSFPRVGL